MGILDPNNTPTNVDFPAMAARRIIEQARMTFNTLLSKYEEGTRLFWNNPRGSTPGDIANRLGTDAAEVFQLHYALGQFLESIKPGCTAEINSSIPWNTFTLNQDGTVTVAPQETGGSEGAPV